MSKVLMDNGGLNGCLRGPQGVSAWWKETAQAHVFVLSRSFLLNYLEPNYKASKTYYYFEMSLKRSSVIFHLFPGAHSFVKGAKMLAVSSF